MLELTLRAGFSADYVLMDNWFIQVPLLEKLMDRAIVIGMMKELNRFYIFEGHNFKLKQVVKMPNNLKGEILCLVRV